MKIIGKTEDQKYLIEASEYDIANLFGEYSASYLRDKKIKLEPGLIIEVSTAFNKLEWLQRRNREFNDLVKSLREAADKIECNKPLFNRVIDGE